MCRKIRAGGERKLYVERTVPMGEVVNDRGETRAEHIKRINETAAKLAAVLAETAAGYVHVTCASDSCFYFERES